MSTVSRYRFGRFQVFPTERKLLVDGQPSAVGGRAFDLLLTLIEHRARVLSKDELLDHVWPDAAVEPNNLAVQIGSLRKVLGPDSIATIPGRGYLFSTEVDESPRRSTSSPVAAAPIAKLKSNLPDVPAALIGRADELATLDALLDLHPVLTITGAGGIGKSHLAQHLLHRRRDHYAQGVCWVELADVTDSTGLPAAIASALGIELGGGEPAAALRAALAPMAVLVALDNAEHLLEDVAALVATLGDTAAALRLLVTSQAPLHVPREQVFRLEALALPPGPMAAAQAAGYGAVALFVERARAADSRFVFDDANAPAVIDLCKRLDGLALAIELAAARAPLLGVQRIVESLDERLALLTAGKRNAPARQQTLRAALEWSHGLLDPHERTVFRRMAVTVGSASLELVQAIAADEEADGATPGGLDRWAVVEALSGLVDRSLVAIAPEGDRPERPRYRLLDSPRAYAVERLQEAGESERLLERHARAIGQWLATAWDDRWGGRIGADAWRRSIQPDRDNARTALAWALARGDLSLVLMMAPVLLMRMAPEGTHTDRLVLAETLDTLLAGQPAAASQLLTRTMLTMFWHARQPQRALAEAERAIALAREANDRFVHHLLLSLVARTAFRLGEAEQAAGALAEMRATEDPRWPPHRRYWGAEAEALCITTDGQGGAAAALPLWRKALALGHAAGDSVYPVRSNLVDIELAAGEIDAAVASGKAVVELLALARDEYALLLARANLVAALLAQGDVAAARPVAEAGWAQAAAFDSQPFYADYLALMAAMESRWTAAARLAGYATAAYARQNSPRWPNEARACERATGLTRAALGAATFESLLAEGASLADCQIAGLAFGVASEAGAAG